MRLRSRHLAALFVLAARAASAQQPDTSRRENGAVVTGIVHDSIGYRPLAGATVQLASIDSVGRFTGTAITDALGRFLLRDVPDGRYMIGFIHPVLDSLALEPPLREVLVSRHQPVRVDLAIPSPARFRLAVCGPRAGNLASAVVVGVVRDASNGAPAAGVIVTGEWLELSFHAGGIDRRMPRLASTTGENGWYVLCDVPSRGTMTLQASRGADSTDVIEVQVPVDGLLRRELLLGTARTVVVAGSVRSDSVALPPRPVRVGDGLLHGTVVTASGGRPLPHARVRIANGPQAEANGVGEFTLGNAPLGTRMLEVRAVGFYPEYRAIDVGKTGAAVRIALTTLKTVLDTVRVRAPVAAASYRNGFEERRRMGIGHYLTPDDIERRRPIVVSDLFKSVSGVKVQRADNAVDGTLIQVHGMYDEWCSPHVYLDGMFMGELNAEDIDTWVHPRDVKGIEIYAGARVPVQFSKGMAGPSCGSIVIWTR